MEGQIWIFRYIENKIGKTQATLITFVFLIPEATTFTYLAQVSSSIYAALFGITQDTSGNPYLVTKLVTLSLGCNFVPFYRNITEQFTTPELPNVMNVTKNLESLQFFSWWG